MGVSEVERLRNGETLLKDGQLFLEEREGPPVLLPDDPGALVCRHSTPCDDGARAMAHVVHRRFTVPGTVEMVRSCLTSY